MEVLHICRDYSKQKLYRELVTHLSFLGVNQKVYVPVRTAEELNRNINKDLTNVEYQFSNLLQPWHRLLFHRKTKLVYKDIVRNFDLYSVDCMHAHFLFSDGAVAYEIFKNFGIPYIVAVRSTDVNVFFKYMVHLRKIGIMILENAKKIIFITPSYVNKVLHEYLPKSIHNEIKSKIEIIPNGIESVFLTHNKRIIEEKEKSQEIKILYVGSFTKNKNVLKLIETVKKLRSIYPSSLTLVGAGGREENAIMKLLKKPDYNFIHYLGRITDRNKLKEIYSNHDIFALISYRETFGIVYIEALSQGLPIIYTKNTGIDGYFKDGEVGYSVDPDDKTMVMRSILKAFDNKVYLEKNAIKKASEFNWKYITSLYLKIYNKLLLSIDN